VPRMLCAVCLHQDSQVRDWFDAGESVTFICGRAVPALLPSDIEFHSRHSSRKITLAESTTQVDSLDVHETIQSRREELKKKLERVSKLLDRELDSPTSQKGLKDASQEFRMLNQLLNQIDSEIAEQEAKKPIISDENRSRLVPDLMDEAPSTRWVDAVVRKVAEFKLNEKRQVQ
jgi:hypothetical protein